MASPRGAKALEQRLLQWAKPQTGTPRHEAQAARPVSSSQPLLRDVSHRGTWSDEYAASSSTHSPAQHLIVSPASSSLHQQQQPQQQPCVNASEVLFFPPPRRSAADCGGSSDTETTAGRSSETTLPSGGGPISRSYWAAPAASGHNAAVGVKSSAIFGWSPEHWPSACRVGNAADGRCASPPRLLQTPVAAAAAATGPYGGRVASISPTRWRPLPASPREDSRRRAASPVRVAAPSVAAYPAASATSSAAAAAQGGAAAGVVVFGASRHEQEPVRAASPYREPVRAASPYRSRSPLAQRSRSPQPQRPQRSCSPTSRPQICGANDGSAVAAAVAAAAAVVANAPSSVARSPRAHSRGRAGARELSPLRTYAFSPSSCSTQAHDQRQCHAVDGEHFQTRSTCVLQGTGAEASLAPTLSAVTIRGPHLRSTVAASEPCGVTAFQFHDPSQQRHQDLKDYLRHQVHDTRHPSPSFSSIAQSKGFFLPAAPSVSHARHHNHSPGVARQHGIAFNSTRPCMGSVQTYAPMHTTMASYPTSTTHVDARAADRVRKRGLAGTIVHNFKPRHVVSHSIPQAAHEERWMPVEQIIEWARMCPLKLRLSQLAPEPFRAPSECDSEDTWSFISEAQPSPDVRNPDGTQIRSPPLVRQLSTSDDESDEAPSIASSARQLEQERKRVRQNRSGRSHVSRMAAHMDSFFASSWARSTSPEATPESSEAEEKPAPVRDITQSRMALEFARGALCQASPSPRSLPKASPKSPPKSSPKPSPKPAPKLSPKSPARRVRIEPEAVEERSIPARERSVEEEERKTEAPKARGTMRGRASIVEAAEALFSNRTIGRRPLL